MAEADKARHLLHGLSRELIKDVMLLDNNTPEEVLQNARKAEIARSYSSTTDTIQSELLQKANDQISELTKKLAELTVEVKDSKSTIEKSARLNNLRTYQQPDYYGRRSRTYDGRPYCFTCNRPGHIAVNCRVPIQKQRVNSTNYTNKPNYYDRTQQNNTSYDRSYQPNFNRSYQPNYNRSYQPNQNRSYQSNYNSNKPQSQKNYTQNYQNKSTVSQPNKGNGSGQ